MGRQPSQTQPLSVQLPGRQYPPSLRLTKATIQRHLSGRETRFHKPLLGLMTLWAHPQVGLFESVIVAFIRWCCDSILMMSLGRHHVGSPTPRFIPTEDHFSCQMLATAQSPWTYSFCFLPPLSRHHRFGLQNQSPAAMQHHHEWD